MNPKAAFSGPSSRRRNKIDRRQYQSCDRCRKGRRGCDADSLGIDPFGRSEPTTSSQIRRRGCSRCQKFNKECTFEWLRSIPRQVLPRRLKPKPNPSEQRFRDQPGFNAVIPSADLSPTNNAQQPEKTGTGTKFHDDLNLDNDLDGFPLPDIGLPLAVDNWIGSIPRPTLSGQTAAESFSGTARDFVSSNLFDQSGFSGDQFHGTKSTGRSSDPTVWVQNNEHTGQIYIDSSHDQIFDTLWVGEAHPSSQSDPRMPIPTIDGIQTTSLEDQNNLLGLEYHQNMGWFPTATSPSICTVDAELLTNCVATQHCPTINMQEHRLADKSNKITISNDLMRIYFDTLENALECWIDIETCPYRIETDVGLRSYTVKEQTSVSSFSTTLYNRVHRLDATFSKQRSRPLSRAEDSGSSEALKLAIMAFACQWSHSSRSSSTNLNEKTLALTDEDHAVELPPTSDFEVSDTQEFERLLRLSVWHESQRCLKRWRYCGSFRVIFASIVLFCSQQPLDEDEPKEFGENHLGPFASQDLGAGKSEHSSLDCLEDQLNSSAPSSNSPAQVFANQRIPDLTLFSSSFSGHEGLQHLEIGLHQLLTWRRSIISSHLHKHKGGFHTETTEVPCDSNALPGSQDLSDFNRFFWLGVMCDTTSSVLNQRSLIIPDNETFISSDGVTRLDMDSITTTTFGASRWRIDVDHHHPSNRMIQSVDIWGSYLLDADRIWQRSLVAMENLSTSQLKSKKIKQGVPLKLLFWRKVGKLQNMISSHEQQPMSSPTPTEVENAIKEALAVHQYWTVNYGEFFTACTREHLNLSIQSRSWYLVLVLGWNMACLILAQYIDFVDRNDMSEKLGQSLRGSSALTNELKKTSAYAIAEAAGVSSCLPTTSSSLSAGEDASLAADTSATKSSHPVLLGQSAIHSDPQTEKVVKALEIASEILLDWLRQWRSPAVGDYVPHLSWLYTSTSSDEISRHCISCINALNLLRSKSDVARLTAEHLIVRYSLLNVATR
jgi:Fungal Zn(2)-Cys(6) binuclear cluster domain